MENRCQVALLTLGDGAGTTFARWQSFWLDKPITWGGASFEYQQLDWAGLVTGQGSSEQVSITLPALPSIRRLAERALAGAWLTTLNVYSFPDDGTNDSGPPASMTLLASTIGEVVSGSATLTTVTLQLGSALSPVGAQFPPRSATTPLIGVPCRL